MIIPEDFAQITHIFTGASVPKNAVVTYGVRNLLNYSAAVVAGKAASAWDTSNFDACVAANCDMVVTRCKLGPNEDGPYADYAFTVGGAGTASGAAAVSMLIGKQTATGGRRGRGRMFLPGIPEANVDEGGRFTSGAVSTAQAAGVALLSALSTQDIPMVLLHGTVGAAPYDVTSLTPSIFPATQRRRQPRALF